MDIDPPKNKRSFDMDSPELSHSAPPPLKVSRLATVPLHISKQKHAEMDQKVASMTNAHLNDNGWDSRQAAILLAAIVLTSGEALDQDYANIFKGDRLLKEHDALTKILEEAWKEQKFARIRELGILQAKSSSRTAKFSTDFFTGPDEREATAKAWDVEYSGSSHHVLEQTIHKMNATRGNLSYSNFVPIVQSSGMGKSRLVDELAKTLFTIPFNLRAANETSGFPRPDHETRDFLRVKGLGAQRETRSELRLRYLVFLANLFATVEEKVRAFPPQSSRQALAKLWRDHLMPNGVRSRIYNMVLETSHYNSSADASAAELAKRSVEKLLAAISERSGSASTPGDVELVLYFDESHDLTTDIVRDKMVHYDTLDTQSTAYQTLCWAFNHLQDYPIFVIYLSTKLDLENPSPARPLYPSARARDVTFSLQAPFVELPFDVWNKPIVKENTVTLDQVCEDEFMVRFGRPLFWSRYNTGSAAVRRDIVNFAIAKLTGSRSDVLLPSEEACLSAISMRLLLEFEPGRYEAALMDNKLVAGHMRVAYSVPSHREYMHAGAPSEPILAEAAAQVMTRFSVLTMLSKYLENGLISKGERGVLVARLLLTLAHDRAVMALSNDAVPKGLPGPRSQPTQTRFSRAIPVICFLRELVGEAHLNTILQSKPDNVASEMTFQEAFKDARIHFTHFSKAGDSCPISDDAAWKTICRGIAFQCFDRQVDIDFMLAIMMRKDDTLGRYHMSSMLIQIKNSAKRQSVHIDAEKLNFFTPSAADEMNPRPYIALTMELGVQPRPPSHSRSVAQMSVAGKETEKRGGKTTKKAKAKAAEPEHTPIAQASSSDLRVPDAPANEMETRQSEQKRRTHPRYAISITGCSSAVYSVIGAGEKDVYARMLSSRSMLDEHPRQSESCLDAVRRLKPMWWYGTSFDWAEGDANDSTMQPYTIPELQEGVSVRSFVPVEEGDMPSQDSSSTSPMYR